MLTTVAKSRFFIALFIFLFPLTEFLGLRYWLHAILGLRLGWGNLMVDTDLAVPLVPAFFLFFFFKSEMQTGFPRLQKKTVLLNLAFLTAFICVNLAYAPLKGWAGASFQLLWWGSAIGTLASAFFIWVPFRFYFEDQNWKLLVPCSVMALSIILSKHFFNGAWIHLIESIRVDFCPQIQNFVREPVSCSLVTQVSGERALKMSVPMLRVFIGRPCGGLDALIFFANLSALVFLKYRDSLSMVRWALASLSGLLFIFVLNPFRIAFLFIGAVHLNHYFPSGVGLAVFKWLVHANAGWVLYLSFGVTYFLAVLPVLKAGTSSLEKRATAKFGPTMRPV